MKNLNGVLEALLGMLSEVSQLTEAATKGNLSHRADVSKLNGGYMTLVQGVNETMDAVIEPLKMTAGYIDRIGKGDIPEKITDTYYGDFDEIKNSINSCIDGLGGLQEGYARHAQDEPQRLFHQGGRNVSRRFSRGNQGIHQCGEL